MILYCAKSVQQYNSEVIALKMEVFSNPCPVCGCDLRYSADEFGEFYYCNDLNCSYEEK
jgi:hypothetical protein